MSERAPKKATNPGEVSRIATASILSIAVGFFGGAFYEMKNPSPTAAAAEAPTPPRPHHRPKLIPSPTPTESIAPTPTPTLAPTPIPTPTKTKTPKVKPTPTATPNAAKAPLIVLDPGHDGLATAKYTIDKQTGLSMSQYANHPELEEVFHVAELVKDGLEKDGYQVMMTKQEANGSATLRERAEVAIQNHADLEVSIHDDHTRTPKDFEAVYAQFDGGFRQHGKESPVVCRDPAIAKASLKAAKAIAQARTVSTGYTTTLQKLDFTARTNLDGGNMSMIDLFDCIDKNPVPAVYNEMGGLTGGKATTRLPEKTLRNYATGLIDGIEAAVPYHKID